MERGPRGTFKWWGVEQGGADAVLNREEEVGGLAAHDLANLYRLDEFLLTRRMMRSTQRQARGLQGSQDGMVQQRVLSLLSVAVPSVSPVQADVLSAGSDHNADEGSEKVAQAVE